MKTLSHYRQRPHWSYSSLNQLLNICSLQWYFAKIEKLPYQFRSPGLVLGSAFHRTMEWIALNRLEGRVPGIEASVDRFQDTWEREVEAGEEIRFGERTDAETCAEQGRNLCQLYVGQIDPLEQILRVSEVFAVPVGTSEKPLIGEFDCVTERAGKTTIVDWKTSARRWPKTQADGSLQATAYLYAHTQLHPQVPADFRFDVLVKNKSPVLEHHDTQRNPDQFQRLEKLVVLADRMVEHELFYPSDGSFYCGSCPFADACAAWQQQRMPVRTRTAA